MATSSAGDEQLRTSKLQALAKGIATIPGGLVNENYRMAPIIMSNCNAADSWSFSSASLDYKEGFCFPLGFWLPKGAESILNVIVKKGESPNANQMKAVNRLSNFVYEGKHQKCLEWLKNQDQKKEAVVQAVLAIHLFAPLSNDGKYVVGNHFPKNLRQCPSCHENICLGDTSFGNTSVWFGHADIEIQRSVVKVDTDAKLSVEDESYLQSNHDNISSDSNSSREFGEENGSGEPSAKRSRIESTGSVDDSFSESDDNISSKKSGSTSIVEVKLDSSSQQKTARSQAIAQAIVNSFCEVKKNPHLLHSYIPSFLATEKRITIILYNCENDKLLYSEPLFIWRESETLDFSSIIHVWLALNFDLFEASLPFEKSLPQSNFQKIVGDKIEIYKKMVSRPSVKVEKQSNSMNLQRYALDKEFKSTVEKNTVLNEYSLLLSNMVKTDFKNL